MKRITVAALRRRDACRSQVEKFEALFPRGAAVNVENVEKAITAGLDVSFLCYTKPDGSYNFALDRVKVRHKENNTPAWQLLQARVSRINASSSGWKKRGELHSLAWSRFHEDIAEDIVAIILAMPR